jgi:hypothetical protein
MSTRSFESETTLIMLLGMQETAHAFEKRRVHMVVMPGEFSESINLRRYICSFSGAQKVANKNAGGAVPLHRPGEVLGSL